jgi:hypothetical protein
MSCPCCGVLYNQWARETSPKDFGPLNLLHGNGPMCVPLLSFPNLSVAVQFKLRRPPLSSTNTFCIIRFIECKDGLPPCCSLGSGVRSTRSRLGHGALGVNCRLVKVAATILSSKSHTSLVCNAESALKAPTGHPQWSGPATQKTDSIFFLDGRRCDEC